MPSRPPALFSRPRRSSNWSKASAEERGYGKLHRWFRKQVLAEEPLCRMCQAEGRVTPTVIADHIVPLSQGGRTIRSNYQGLCEPHHRAKTAAEAARGAALTRCR